MRTKALSTAVRERIALWYLRKGKDSVSLEQLVDMAESMEGPCIVNGKMYQDHASLKAFIGKEIYKKHHPEKVDVGIPS
jgi:hypothetical protein